MKTLASVAVLVAACAVQSIAMADTGDMSLTRADVTAQLTQAYLHDTRAVDEVNTYPNPTMDRHYIAQTRQKAFKAQTSH